MTRAKTIPRSVIAALATIDIGLVVVLLFLATWNTWHDGRMSATPSEYRPLLTWLIYAIPVAVANLVVFVMVNDLEWEIRPKEWDPDA